MTMEEISASKFPGLQSIFLGAGITPFGFRDITDKIDALEALFLQLLILNTKIVQENANRVRMTGIVITAPNNPICDIVVVPVNEISLDVDLAITPQIPQFAG